VIALLSCFAAGLLFALGLGVSGMLLPSKVLGFLDVTCQWDPSLAFVMGTAVPVYAIAHRLVLMRKRPLLAPALPEQPAAAIDRPLAIGAALFGAGWGLSGVCPGPAIVNLGGLAPGAALFCAAMLAGMALEKWTYQLRRKPSARAACAD